MEQFEALWAYQAEDIKADAIAASIKRSPTRQKLEKAGSTAPVFEDAAIEAILNSADGTPRLINKYCNAALVIGHSKAAPLITTDIVMNAINDSALE